MDATHFFVKVNKLNELWTKVEEILGRHPIEPPGARLTVGRHGDHMRIMYDGRPLTQCKAAEKIDAAYHLPNLVRAIEDKLAVDSGRADTACEILSEWLKEMPDGL